MSQKWFNNIDLQQNELQNGVIQNLAADPTSGKAGQIYYNTADKGYRYHNGTQWVSITAEAVKSIIAGNGLTSSGTDVVTISLGTPSASGSGSNTYGSNDVTTNSHTHQISLPDASESAKGVIGIASQTEVNEGANITKAVTPGALAKGKSGGVASLDTNGKILLSQIPDSIYGNVLYGGNLTAFTEEDTYATVAISSSLRERLKLAPGDTTITIANTGTVATPALTYGYAQLEGVYFICEAAGSWGLTGNFEVGDWVISTGTSWQKVDNTDAVKSVNGKMGTVVLTYEDVDAVTVNDVDQHIKGTKVFEDALFVGKTKTGTLQSNYFGVGNVEDGAEIFGVASDRNASGTVKNFIKIGQDAETSILLNGTDPGVINQALVSQGPDKTPIWKELVTLDTDQDITGNKTFTTSQSGGPQIGIYNGQLSIMSSSTSEGNITWGTPSDNIAADFSVDENGAHLGLGVDAAADIRLHEDAGTAGQMLVSQGANRTPIWSDTAPNAQKVANALTVGAFPANTATDNSYNGSATSFVRFADPFSVTKSGNTTTVTLPSVVQKFTTTITGDGTTTDFTVQHGLGADVMVQVYLTGSTIGRRTGNELVFVDTYVEDANTHQIHLVFAIAPTASQTFKVVVIG